MFGSLTKALAVAVVALTGCVSAHGIVGFLVADGQRFSGANGVDTSPDSPIRRISTGSPVKNEFGNEIICGPDARLANGVVTVNPGSRIEFHWKTESGGEWPHSTGPLVTYMARCNGDCQSFRPNGDTQWFKIDQTGLREPGVPDTWAQRELMTGAPAVVRLPQNLAPGGYIIRHEIIALHLASGRGGAEFYPSCTQVRVTGSGGGQPDRTVNFPGAYYEDHPGLLGNFYNFGLQYDFPGGPVANIEGSAPPPASAPAPSPSPSPSSSTSSRRPTSTSAPPNNAPTATSSPKTGSSKGRCRVRKRSLTADTAANTKRGFFSLHHKRRLSFAH